MMIELDELVFIEQGRKSTFKILVPKQNCVNMIKEKWNEYSMKMLRRYQKNCYNDKVNFWFSTALSLKWSKKTCT